MHKHIVAIICPLVVMAILYLSPIVVAAGVVEDPPKNCLSVVAQPLKTIHHAEKPVHVSEAVTTEAKSFIVIF